MTACRAVAERASRSGAAHSAVRVSDAMGVVLSAHSASDRYSAGWAAGQTFESTREPGAGSFQHGREWNVATVLDWEPGYLRLGLSAVGA